MILRSLHAFANKIYIINTGLNNRYQTFCYKLQRS